MKNYWLEQRKKKSTVTFRFLLNDVSTGNAIFDVPADIIGLTQSINIKSADTTFTNYVANKLSSFIGIGITILGCDAILRVYESGSLVEEWVLLNLWVIAFGQHFVNGKFIASMIVTSSVIGTVNSKYIKIS